MCSWWHRTAARGGTSTDNRARNSDLIGFSSAGDLAFNSGRLYLSSTTHELIEIDLAGSVSGALVGSFGFNDVFGLSTVNNGVLYGIADTSVFSTDTATGAGTLVLDYAGHGLLDAFGPAFFTESGATLVPEPCTLAVVGIGLIGLLGFHARRRAPAFSDS